MRSTRQIRRTLSRAYYVRTRGRQARRAAPPVPLTERSDAELAAVISAQFGILSAAAHQLGVAREDLAERVERSPILQRAVAHGRERWVDRAEIAVVSALREGSWRAVLLVLETFGAARGWHLDRLRAGGMAEGPALPRDAHQLLADPAARRLLDDLAARMTAVRKIDDRDGGPVESVVNSDHASRDA